MAKKLDLPDAFTLSKDEWKRALRDLENEKSRTLCDAASRRFDAGIEAWKKAVAEANGKPVDLGKFLPKN